MPRQLKYFSQNTPDDLQHKQIYKELLKISCFERWLHIFTEIRKKKKDI